jgi:glycosyltransferase involved in cell wall biosynthesis
MNSKLVLIIGLVWPEPKSSAAGTRMLQLILLLQTFGYKIIFASTALENDLNFDLSTIGVEKASIALNSDRFDFLVKNWNPAIVLFDRFVTEEQFGWRVVQNCPTALRILDSEDLHCLRHTRASNFKKGIPFEVSNLFEEDWTKREIASILRCDLTLVIAEFEMELLTRHFKIDAQYLFYLPLLVPESELALDYRMTEFQERKDFVFIGNFWHEPNWDATLYLKKTVWPLIREQLPQAVIRIYGAYPSQKVFDLHNKKDGFLVLGRADDARSVIASARVLIAPIRYGAGLKGKLLEAMQYGTPSVTTSIGAESINGNFGWNGCITDSPNEIASAAVLLYENEELWLQKQQSGKIILQERFQWNRFKIPFQRRLENHLQNLISFRKSNFYGALLLHHTMKSTEYMSRWIEEKNKQAF